MMLSVSITLFSHFYCFCSPVLSSLFGVHQSGLPGDAIWYYLTHPSADWVNKNWTTCHNVHHIPDRKYSHLQSTETNSVFNISASLILLLRFNAYSIISPALGTQAILSYNFLVCIPTKWCPKWGTWFWYGGWIYCNYKWMYSIGQMITGKRKVIYSGTHI
jgi:hypothetical protein